MSGLSLALYPNGPPASSRCRDSESLNSEGPGLFLQRAEGGCLLPFLFYLSIGGHWRGPFGQADRKGRCDGGARNFFADRATGLGAAASKEGDLVVTLEVVSFSCPDVEDLTDHAMVENAIASSSGVACFPDSEDMADTGVRDVAHEEEILLRGEQEHKSEDLDETAVSDDAQQDETVLSTRGEREHKSVIVLDEFHPYSADDDDGWRTASFVETAGSDADVVDLGELDYVDHEASGSSLPMTAGSSLPFECSRIPPMTVLETCHSDVVDDGLRSPSVLETASAEAEPTVLAVASTQAGVRAEQVDGMCDDDQFGCAKKPPVIVLDCCHSDVVEDGLRSPSVLQTARSEADPTVLAFAFSQAASVAEAGVRAEEVDAMCDDDQFGCAKKPPVIVLESCHSDFVDDGLRSPSVLQTARSEADSTVLAFASSQAAAVELGVKAEQVDAMYDDDDD